MSLNSKSKYGDDVNTMLREAQLKNEGEVKEELLTMKSEKEEEERRKRDATEVEFDLVDLDEVDLSMSMSSSRAT